MSSRSKHPVNVKDFIRQLEAEGWRIERGKKNHYRAYSPTGTGIITIPSTPGDHRALRNLEADKRRCEREG